MTGRKRHDRARSASEIFWNGVVAVVVTISCMSMVAYALYQGGKTLDDEDDDIRSLLDATKGLARVLIKPIPNLAMGGKTRELVVGKEYTIEYFGFEEFEAVNIEFHAPSTGEYCLKIGSGPAGSFRMHMDCIGPSPDVRLQVRGPNNVRAVYPQPLAVVDHPFVETTKLWVQPMHRKEDPIMAGHWVRLEFGGFAQAGCSSPNGKVYAWAAINSGEYFDTTLPAEEVDADGGYVMMYIEPNLVATARSTAPADVTELTIFFVVTSTLSGGWGCTAMTPPYRLQS